ncbi:MAG: T9SS C-terminal target domain-containing protein, partial [Methanobacteriota archaeon]
VQSGNDHSPSGTRCFVTDHRAGQSAGSYDVDNGKTTLFSPIYDLSSLENPVIRYWKWYTNEKGANPGQDFWVVDISPDGGQTWVNVENTNEATNGWEKVQFQVSDYITPTSQVQLRFIASDFNPGSLVEALIDDIAILAVGGVTGLSEQENLQLPKEFILDQNYPNPFNPATTIRFGIPFASRVTIEVYNLLGQRINTLYEGNVSPGWHEVVWDGKNQSGIPVSSGIYMYRMQAFNSMNGSKIVKIRKLVLIK